jgi:tRNA (guanine-N7-)-methyltransferase
LNIKNESVREIRSWVRREGRMTKSQQRALERLWPRYGLEADKRIDLYEIFGRRTALTLEIGIGNGETLATLSAREPAVDFIGIEVHRPGIGHLLLELEKRALTNVRMYKADAVQVLQECFPDHSLQRVLLFFPDPWPKKRHHKRRIVQRPFIELLARKMDRRGILHMATDWEDYAQHMLDVMGQSEVFRNCAGAGQFSTRPEDRPVTKFERRGQRLGHVVRDLLFERL